MTQASILRKLLAPHSKTSSCDYHGILVQKYDLMSIFLGECDRQFPRSNSAIRASFRGSHNCYLLYMSLSSRVGNTAINPSFNDAYYPSPLPQFNLRIVTLGACIPHCSLPSS
ncbi:hypothetical protein Salat_1095400 [Sesamum alatum]|uniref:Uncharacterized protein n=1 Tax=Sesamum alatum TaxID=300844 RepID=A0AAE1YN72_9LAMI|nr:hypothetical protein Salat_1095400 [Sesamum alatum]